jgi:hypothetical protein
MPSASGHELRHGGANRNCQTALAIGRNTLDYLSSRIADAAACKCTELRFVAVSFCVGVSIAICLLAPALGQNVAAAPTPDDSLKIYAVGTIETRPYKQWGGNGIYLGRGAIITAAHVVGRIQLLTDQRVVVAGEELPATLIKQGNPDRTDLAVLTIAEARLPVSLRLRLNPVCKAMLPVGAEVVVVSPRGTARSRIMSPRAVPAPYRIKYGTIIENVSHASSGSGVFDATRRCLLGIVARRVTIRSGPGRAANKIVYGKYYAPAPIIARFIPAKYRF